MKAKKAAERKAALAEMEAKEKARKAKLAEQNRKAEAKFKAEGWWEIQDGIFIRWCDREHDRLPWQAIQLHGLHLAGHGLVQGTGLW